MLSFLTQGIRFNARAAAIVLHRGHLLLHRLESDGFWSLPGGRIEPGEAASDAVVRELQEEVGIDAQCHELAFIVENFFMHQGEPGHEIGLYFFVQLLEPCRLSDTTISHVGTEGTRRLEYRWFPLAELSACPLYPAFLRDTDFRTGPWPRHIVVNPDSVTARQTAGHDDPARLPASPPTA